MVSSSQDPVAARMEKRKHPVQHSNHPKQHPNESETTPLKKKSHPHHAAVKKGHPRIKAALSRKGKVYIAGRPDWYNEYRHQRGPHNLMRKLTLESSHRRKATLTFPLMGGGPSSGLEPAPDGDDGGDQAGTESKATDDQPSVKDNPVEPEEESGDGKEEDMGGDGREDEEGGRGRGSQSIQAAKKPQFVGVPTPVSVRHSGIIPKESSCGRVGEQGRMRVWTVVVVVGVVFAVCGAN
ncbi:unnamed protein product [Mortierella alpina]